MSTPILSVRDLGKQFGSLVAARDITVAVPPLQTIGVILPACRPARSRAWASRGLFRWLRYFPP
jgi:hypothetical protein